MIDFTLNDDALEFTLNAETEAIDNARLLEDGDYRLLEDGEIRLLE
jgi:hypothetical protein